MRSMQIRSRAAGPLALLLASCTVAQGILQPSLDYDQGGGADGSHRKPESFRLDWQNFLGLVLAFLVSALANSAGVGGGAFFVPLFNLVVNFSLKQSTALSQATMAGGAIAGVLYGLFCSNPTKPHLPVVSFRLALELGPPLILGTSVGMLGSIVGADGVLANPLVPDWLLVILLTVVLLLLASRVALRAARMHAAESALLHPPDPSDEEQPQRALSDLASAKSGILSPFQRVANGPPELKLKSHPVALDHMSPATSGTDSVAWDLDDELPTSSSGLLPLATHGSSPHAAAQDASSPWASNSGPPPFRDSVDDTSFNYAPVDGARQRPPPVLSRFAAPGIGAEHQQPEPASSSPTGERRLAWGVILLEAALLVSVVAVFLFLQTLKSRYNKCTAKYGGLYAAQAALCLLVSTAWIGLPALVGRRGGSDVEAPLLSRVESFLSADPTARSLFLAAGLALLGGCVAGLVGLGGGVIMSPLLLELGVHPLVAAATSILLVACTTTSAAAEFWLEGLLPVTYSAVYAAVCAAGALAGVAGLGALVRRSGRASYVVLVLAVVIASGGLATAAVGGLKAVRELHHGQAGFQSLCAS